jgi:hypothetical protein
MASNGLTVKCPLNHKLELKSRSTLRIDCVAGFLWDSHLLQVKINRMRHRIAQRLKEAQNTCAMLTTFNEIDMR